MVAKGFFKTYKKTIITAIITVVIAGTIPLVGWSHQVWGDERYVQKANSIRNQIQQIDIAIWEIEQEIVFAETDRQKQKWILRKNFYERQKHVLNEKLNNDAVN